MLSDLLRCACDLCVLNCAPDFFAGGAAEFWGQSFNGENEIRYNILIVSWLSLWSWGDDIDSEEFLRSLLGLRSIGWRNWFVNEGNENIRNIIRLKKKAIKYLCNISRFVYVLIGQMIRLARRGGEKMHDSLIWRKEKREKGRKRETSGSNQGAVSSKRRRIVKEIKSKMQKKRMKKHRWIG